MPLLIFILFIITSGLFAQEISNYNLEVQIDIKTRTITAAGKISIDFASKDTIHLVLWKETNIEEMTSMGEQVQFVFDTSKPSPLMYVPNGRELSIVRPSGDDSMHVIKISYTSDMKKLDGWAQSFTEDWVELNLYSGWFPVSFGRGYTSKFSIHIDPEYMLTGSGIVKKEEDTWLMETPWKCFDNVIIACKSLKSKALKEKDLFIETTYTEFPDDAADSINSECKFIINMFETYFGKNDSTFLRFVVAPFDAGGGYSRKNFVCMRTRHYNFYTQTKGLAHEIAHFWWSNANSTTWEDWLNEAFSEYSMLLYIRERSGVEAFNKLLAEYQERLPKLPIWEIQRNSNDAYNVLYEKGSIVLYELEKLLGKEKFISLLKSISMNKISSTSSLLQLVEKETTKEVSTWLENKLKES